MPPQCRAPRITTGKPCNRLIYSPGALTCESHAGVDPSRLCTALAGRGKARTRCLAWPVTDQATCRDHNPDVMARRRAAARVSARAEQTTRLLFDWEAAHPRTQRLVFEALTREPWFDVGRTRSVLTAKEPPAGAH